jgi:hypothetical protein
MSLLKALKKLCCCLNKFEEDELDTTTNPINPQNFEAHQVYPYKKSFS